MRSSIDKQNQYYSQLNLWLKDQKQRLDSGQNIDSHSIAQLADEYRVKASSDADKLQQLLLQIDEIPHSLALAQAAKESAWGTSRFARKANNYFGQWCFSKGCGLAPAQRNKDSHHEVRRFASAEASVAAYFRNINRHKSYREIWNIRQNLRKKNEPVTGLKLAEGLKHYSSRGEAYIHELKDMIRFNKLE